jgi:osmotically-inducible protein OsmY
MMRLRWIVPLALVLSLPLTLGGCVGALVVGGLAAAGEAGYTAAHERGVSGGMEDFRIKTNIETAWAQASPQLGPGMTVTVYNERVLLTGRVTTPELKAQAKQIASASPGVRAVYDELDVGPIETAWESAKDAWITGRLRAEMMADPDIRSGNYTIETADQSIYLIGSARSQTELDKATRMARYVPDARRVVSYVEIRSGMPVASQPAPPMGRPNPSLDGPAGAPRAPVTVEKL